MNENGNAIPQIYIIYEAGIIAYRGVQETPRSYHQTLEGAQRRAKKLFGVDPAEWVFDGCNVWYLDDALVRNSRPFIAIADLED